MKIEDLLRNPMKNAVGYTAGGKPLPPIPDGVTICKLNANENQLGPSKKVVEVMKESLEELYLYPFEQTDIAREKIAKWQGVASNNVVITAGSSSLIAAVGDMFLNPGDEIVISSPTYMNYYPLPLRYDAKMVEVDNYNHASDVRAMLNAITDKTKLAIIVNPNNPTGAKVSNEDIAYFMEHVPEHVITVVDEAYLEWADDDEIQTTIPYVLQGKNVIILKTFSKLFGLAGLRIGYMITTPEIQQQFLKIEFNYGCTRLGLKALAAAIDDQEYVKQSIANNTLGRLYLTKEMRDLGFEVVESYTSFVYFKPTISAQDLLEQLHVRGCLVRPFGDYLRVSIGRPEQNHQYIDALKDILKD